MAYTENGSLCNIFASLFLNTFMYTVYYIEMEMLKSIIFFIILIIQTRYIAFLYSILFTYTTTIVWNLRPSAAICSVQISSGSCRGCYNFGQSGEIMNILEQRLEQSLGIWASDCKMYAINTDKLLNWLRTF